MKTRSQREAKRVQRERTLGKNLGAAGTYNRTKSTTSTSTRRSSTSTRSTKTSRTNCWESPSKVLHEETGRANQRQHFLQERLAGGVGESAPDQSPSGQSLHQQVHVEGDSEESEIGMCRTFSKAPPFIPMNARVRFSR
jgi:hypothetical protein